MSFLFVPIISGSLGKERVYSNHYASVSLTGDAQTSPQFRKRDPTWRLSSQTTEWNNGYPQSDTQRNVLSLESTLVSHLHPWLSVLFECAPVHRGVIFMYMIFSLTKKQKMHEIELLVREPCSLFLLWFPCLLRLHFLGQIIFTANSGCSNYELKMYNNTW